MNTLVAFLAAAEPTNPAETWYSPGVIGFIATFGVTIAAVALIFDMVRRVRRVRYRAEIQAKIDAEQQAKSAPKAPAKPTVKASDKPVAKAAPATAKVTPKAAPAARAKPARPAPPAKPKRD
jgi:hypothetical protein